MGKRTKGSFEEEDEEKRKAAKEHAKRETEAEDDTKRELSIKRLQSKKISLRNETADKKNKIKEEFFTRLDDSLTEMKEAKEEVELQSESILSNDYLLLT